jgi:hypothetical protein
MEVHEIEILRVGIRGCLLFHDLAFIETGNPQAFRHWVRETTGIDAETPTGTVYILSYNRKCIKPALLCILLL